MSDLSLPSRPIVHVGYHKTATTWFQQKVWPTATSHDWVPRAKVQAAFLAAPGMHFDPLESAAVLELEGRTRPVVLSEENLSGYIHNGGLHGLIGPEMARRIRAVLPDARIVLFIRNQREIVRAAYAQYVSGGGTFSLKRYLDSQQHLRGALTRPYKAPAFEWEHFEFDRLIAHYDRLFGRENVHVYPYEALRDRPALLRRLRRELGVALPLSLAEGGGANRSLGAGALLALRFANLFTRQSVVNKSWLVDLPGGQVLRHAVKRALALFPAGRFTLPGATLERIEAHYAEANRRLAALRPDLPLEELGYPLAPGLPQAAASGALRTAA